MSIPAPADFTSRLRSPAVAARVGVWLGIAFGICFLTGLVSHYAQLPNQPVPFPTSPSWGYRLTQGLHVVTGVAAVSLLLVKLWTVYPLLFERLPAPRDVRPLVAALLERASIAVLVAAAVFQLATGLVNATRWYPWSQFSFRASHYAVAWIAIGALVVHIGVKLPIIRTALGADIDDTSQDRPGAGVASPLSRRALVRTSLGAAGVGVLATAGSAVPLLRRVSLFAVNSGTGPSGVPINKTAAQAGVIAAATSADYALAVVVDDQVVRSFTLADLRAMPQATETLPIACVEGWSASGDWTGVRMVDVLSAAGASEPGDVVVASLQDSGPFAKSILPANFVRDRRTLLALGLNGDALSIDHGSPCRLIAPNRPGVLQTKWVSRLEVST